MFDEDVIQAYMAAWDVSRDQAIAALSAVSALGGGSAKNDVYYGESKTQVQKPTRGAAKKTVSEVQVTKKTKDESYNLFWSDPTTQNRVLSYLELMGKGELGKPGAYEVWKDIVDQAADIYNGGKGSKITPYELLNMSMQGASATGIDTTRQINKYDADVLKEVANSIALKKRGAKLTEQELKDAIALADTLIQKGTVTKTEKVRNPKTGKMENVVTVTPGYSEERFSAELGKKIEKENPEMVERRKAFEFSDILSRALGVSGI